MIPDKVGAYCQQDQEQYGKCLVQGTKINGNIANRLEYSHYAEDYLAADNQWNEHSNQLKRA